MEKFADIMRDLIIEKDLSLRKLATESNVSATQYSKYLRGSYPTLPVAIRIANYFECSLDYLFGLSNIKLNRQLKDINLDKFLPRYQDLLKKNKITHWKFAKENNLSEACIRHWEYGETPKIESLIIIASGLSSSIDYIVGRYD